MLCKKELKKMIVELANKKIIKKLLQKENINLKRSKIEEKIFEFIGKEYIKIKNREIRECETQYEKERMRKDFLNDFENFDFTNSLIDNVYILFLEKKVEFLEKSMNKIKKSA